VAKVHQMPFSQLPFRPSITPVQFPGDAEIDASTGTFHSVARLKL
jgi:hypothetical protein